MATGRESAGMIGSLRMSQQFTKRKRKKENASNYRPVSLTLVCKMLKIIIKYKIVKFLEVNKLIPYFQHEFRVMFNEPNKFFCYICNNWDSKIATDDIYLDFEKALDKVAHT